MTSTHFNLLEDPLIEITDVSGASAWVDLPTVLARLTSEQELEFPGLPAHHQHPWHAFLVQLAAIALDRAEQDGPSADADVWRTLLLALTPEPEAWCLIVEDLGKPAFMQPPVPEGDLSKLKNSTRHPDKLDLLVTAKNHEVKAETVATDDLLSAARQLPILLIAYQTFNRYTGSGNYGSSRLNGGYGSRPAVCLTPDLRWPTRFRRDLNILLDHRGEVAESHNFADCNGHALLWLIPWSGEADKILNVDELDPWFLEVCRRVRITLKNGLPILNYGSTASARVAAKELNGNIGDPWTPIRIKGNKKNELAALTLSERGFHYRVVSDLLFSPEYLHPPTLNFSEDEPTDMIAVFMALVGGQGKTGGYHERYELIPSKVSSLIRDQGTHDLANLAQSRIELTAEVQRRVLKPALLALLQGGTDDLNFKDDRAQAWLRRLDRTVDRLFFNALFDHIDLSSEEKDLRWQMILWRETGSLFDEAVDILPRNAAREPATVAQASSLLKFKARQILPAAFPPAKAQTPELPEPSEHEGTAA